MRSGPLRHAHTHKYNANAQGGTRKEQNHKDKGEPVDMEALFGLRGVLSGVDGNFTSREVTESLACAANGMDC